MELTRTDRSALSPMCGARHRRAGGLACGVAVVLLAAAAGPAVADAGDAHAVAARASLTGTIGVFPVDLVDLSLSEVHVSQGDEDAEATETLLSVDLPVLGPVPLVSADVVSSTASSDHVRAQASSFLSDVVVSLPLAGLPTVLTLDAISSSAVCHIVEAPVGSVEPPVQATLLGVPIEIVLNEDIVVDIGIAIATLRIGDIEETADSATATGLTLALNITIPLVASLDLDLTLAESGCERGIPEQPLATALDPASGPETGGTLVTLIGEKFVPGFTAINIGTASVPADEVDVIDGMTLQFVTPAHAAGLVDVTVKTPGGVTAPPLPFEYLPVGPGQPVALTIDPNSGPESGGTLVTITGDSFVVGDTVVHIGANTVPAGEVNVLDAMTLQFTTPPHLPAIVAVTVGTSGGVSNPPLSFEYVPDGPGQPVTVSIEPDSGPESGGTLVTITGDNFVVGDTVVHIGPNTVPAGEVVVVDAMTLQFTTPPHVPEVVDVTVETPGGVSDPPLSFEYLPGGPGQPIALALDPDRGPATGGTLVTITGDNFVPGATSVHIGTNTVPADEVDVLDAMTLEFSTPPHVPEVVDVTVETSEGVSDPPLAFEYESTGPGQPVASTIDPGSGPESGGTLVVITGENFVPGATAINIGTASVPPGEVDVIDAMTLEFTTPPHTSGVVNVTVKTPGGTSNPLPFEYEADDPGAPVANTIEPGSGPESGGTIVVITGENFVPGQTAINIGTASVPVNEVNVIDAMTLEFTTPPHAPGIVDVTVKTPGGVSNPLPFEYEADGGVDERVPVALDVDFSPLISDGNDIFEPGERVEVAPVWLNDGPDTLDLTGTASDFDGPAGPNYTLVSPSADYGMVAPGAIASCQDTGVCYEMEVGPLGVPRPAQHWDTAFDETLSDGTTHSWILHIGDTFLDMPRSSVYYPFVETIVHNAITGGCTAAEFCGQADNTRAQMAPFVLRSFEGPDYVAPACTPGTELFDDVPASSIFCPWIEELARRQVVGGCDEDNYCPNAPVSRAQMSVFLMRTLEGPGYIPPSCSGLFVDVPCPSVFADWIEDLSVRDITAGCETEPHRYCPSEPLTRQQMAVFLTRTFGLVIYGP